MLRYVTYLLHLGFHPVTVVGNVVHTKIGERQQYTKGEIINETIKSTEYIK